MAHPQLNATATSLLGFLHFGPLTGWELVEVAEQVIGDFWSLTRSQVYRELAAMDAAGLVVAGERGPRDRRPYTVTDQGRQAFAEAIARPPAAETIRFPLLLTISFGEHLPPDVLAEFVRDHQAVHEERLARYRADNETAENTEGASDFARATLRFGLMYEQAVVSWFHELPSLIPGLAEVMTATTERT